MRGRRPAPLRLRALDGLRGDGRRGDPDAETPNLTPVFPLEGRMMELWDEVLETLTPLGILHPCDSFALTRYVSLLARWERVEQFLREHGDTYQGKGGLTKLYPQSSIALQLAAALLAIEQLFGMSPLSRTRLPVAKPRVEDEAKARLFKPRFDNPA